MAIDSGLKAAVDAAGSKSELARRLGITPAAVIGWKRIPVDRAHAVADATGVPLEKLRPDIWEPAKKRGRQYVA